MMKYGIMLRSKHTREEIYLGVAYDSLEKAKESALIDVCMRCNNYSIIPIRDGEVWISRQVGWRHK